MTVDIRDMIKHSTKKSGKCPKTLRGVQHGVPDETQRSCLANELDAIIEESRKISALTKITECISPCIETTKLGWKRVSRQLILERART